MPRILIQDATVATMDDRLGDVRHADILVENDRIAAIQPTGATFDADIIDAQGFIVIPGLVNAHMHTWQTALRGIGADWTLPEYLKKMHAGLATVFRPEDLYIANLVGALNQINCGTTTLVDWCHNNPTPAHNDAAIDALNQSGMRAAFFQGSPKPDPKSGDRPFWEIPHPRAELERLLKQGASALVTIGAAILGPHYSTMEVSRQDFEMARELNIVASMHQGGGPARTPEGWETLEREGLLGPNVNIVHGNGLTDSQIGRFCELGMSFSVTPEAEMTYGHGHPITTRLRKFNRAPSLGVDIESAISGEMLTVARMALAMDRALDNADYRKETGRISQISRVQAREALSWATIEGARMLRMEDRIGSITPGKQADLVMIDASALNMQPVHDAVATVLLQSSLANINSVMIAGQWQKRSGKLMAGNVSQHLTQLRASGERILNAMGIAIGAS
jgi:cytosine/adenosine deaminase-related metal-dependent hydrolase